MGTFHNIKEFVRQEDLATLCDDAPLADLPNTYSKTDGTREETNP